jgi:hypothetical protein
MDTNKSKSKKTNYILLFLSIFFISILFYYTYSFFIPKYLSSTTSSPTKDEPAAKSVPTTPVPTTPVPTTPVPTTPVPTTPVPTTPVPTTPVPTTPVFFQIYNPLGISYDESITLKNWFPYLKTNPDILYVGSRDGFSDTIYSEKCNKCPTLSLIRISNGGDLIGGYTQICREKGANSWVGDEKAFIFNLTKKIIQKPIIHPNHAIHTNLDNGIIFGNGNDLLIKIGDKKWSHNPYAYGGSIITNNNQPVSGNFDNIIVYKLNI